MPTYDYLCQSCGHEFELFQQMNEPVKRKCPECSKLKLQRLIGTGAGVIFKGGGFYETDYRSESYKKAAEAEKKSASSNGEAKKKKSDTSSDGASSTSGSKDSASTSKSTPKKNADSA